MVNKLSKQTVLIIGAGHVGEACAFKLIEQGIEKIILHTLTEKESCEVATRIEPYAKGKTEVVKSWGDVLLPTVLANKSKKEIVSSKKDSSLLLSYYFDPLSDEIVKKSFLYKLAEKIKPDIIIDSTNTATMVGYTDDPYSLPRKIINDENKKENTLINLLLSNPIAPLIRFVQVLKKIMDDINIDSYVKVSTTGLGGMGINLSYTHGDLNELGMSSGILGKVAAAGIMHQLFWSLSHTPRCNIKVVVPATLIGWQYVGYGDFRSRGANLHKVFLPEKQKISKDNKIVLEKTKLLNDTIKIPYVDSGENNAYMSTPEKTEPFFRLE